jgi:hypothetical protein
MISQTDPGHLKKNMFAVRASCACDFLPADDDNTKTLIAVHTVLVARSQ